MPAKIEWNGKRIGRVNVISLVTRGNGGSKWNCKCDCGENFICWAVSFKRGNKFECKKCMLERKRPRDLEGRKFGRWTVLKRVIDKNNKTSWHCLCDCGKEGYVSTSVLGKKGRSQSCGCLGRKLKSKHINVTQYPPSHGLSKEKFYQMKTSLIHKCYNEKHPSFSKFGAIGIGVCDLWRNGVKDMHEWAISKGWEEGDVFYLKEGEKQFNPETVEILKENEFRSLIALNGGTQITYQGETHSVLKWAKMLNVNPGQLRKRLLRTPSLDEVFGVPFKKMTFLNNPSLVKEVVNLYVSGESVRKIANIYKVCGATILYHLAKENIELRKDDPNGQTRKDISNETILELYNQGIEKNEIARRFGCSYPCIDNRLKKIQGLKRDRSNG